MRISDWSSDVCSSDLIPVVGARHIDHRMMARAARDLEILLKNLAHRLERPGRRRTHRISDRIVGTGPAALRPHQIIDAAPLHLERALDLTWGRDFTEGHALGKRLDRSHALPAAPARDIHPAPLIKT